MVGNEDLLCALMTFGRRNLRDLVGRSKAGSNRPFTGMPFRNFRSGTGNTSDLKLLEDVRYAGLKRVHGQ